MILELPSNDLLLVYDGRREASDSSCPVHSLKAVASSVHCLLDLLLHVIAVHGSWHPFSEDKGRPEGVVQSNGGHKAALVR